MKIAGSIVIGCCIIASAIFFGLTSDKRAYMETCLSQMVTMQSEAEAQFYCEMRYKR